MDPSGNIPGLGGVGSAIGDAAVGGAKRVPDAWKPGIRNAAQKGNDFINNWYSKPDDCSCGSGAGAPQLVIDTATGINDNVASPAAQFAFAAYTAPAKTIASQVDVYGRWPASTRFGQVGVDKLYRSYQNVDVTNLKLVDYSRSYKYTNGAGHTSKILRMADGRKVVIHNAKTKWRLGGFRGAEASVIGAGLMEGAFQAYRDWAEGLCLSPNQRFWRAYGAMFAGFAAGAAGTIFVGLFVAGGAPALVAGLAGFAVSMAVGKALEPYKNNFVDLLGELAGRY